jgi:hypothetical protein
MTSPNPESMDIPQLNTAIPSAARIYDYTLGGSANYEADRMAAEGMFQLLPSTKKWVRMLRSFLQEAAQTLHDEGFTQFLDLASGLPTQDHVHSVLPEARVVYNDIDPVTVSHGRILIAGLPNVRYSLGDVRQIEAILDSEAVHELIDRNEKIAIGFNGINVFLTDEEVSHIAHALYDWAPAGSKLYVSFETKNPEKITPQWEAFLGAFAATGSPMQLHSLEKNIELMQPWQVDKLNPLSKFLGLPADFVTEADREGIDLEFLGCIMKKQD